MEVRIVLTTAGSPEEGEKIARSLVEGQLAACVNIVPRIRSIYRWNGQVEAADEHLLIIKTTEANFPAVRDSIKDLHSYDLPECIALAPADGSEDYMKWILADGM